MEAFSFGMDTAWKPFDYIFSAQQARKNRQFQKNQRKTRYQDTIQDLKAANLNPILAVGGMAQGNLTGSQAQTPAGSNFTEKAASAKAVKIQDKMASESVLEMISRRGLNSALSLKAESEQLKNKAAAMLNMEQINTEKAKQKNLDQSSENLFWDAKAKKFKGNIFDDAGKIINPVVASWVNKFIKWGLFRGSAYQLGRKIRAWMDKQQVKESKQLSKSLFMRLKDEVKTWKR